MTSTKPDNFALEADTGGTAPVCPVVSGKLGRRSPQDASFGGNPTIFHGTPLSPRAALESVMPGRSGCVSFYRPDDVALIEKHCPKIMYDCGAFSFWQKARKAGEESANERDWSDYFAWLEPRLFADGRDAIIPDIPGAPSQVNDAMLGDWPYPVEKGLPVFHMNGPISRLGRLCERYPVVALGWVGETSADNVVGSDAYHRTMDGVAGLMGNQWHSLHMLRGVAVARDYPFHKGRQHRARSKRMEARQPIRCAVGRSLARSAGVC